MTRIETQSPRANGDGDSRSRETSETKDDFVSVARRLGADESKERLEKKLKKIANAQPPESKRK